jgi:hypothetical protein
MIFNELELSLILLFIVFLLCQNNRQRSQLKGIHNRFNQVNKRLL